MDNVEIAIRDDELIAGNRTVKPRAGIVSPEMDPYWIDKELDSFIRGRRISLSSLSTTSRFTVRRCCRTGRSVR